MARSLAVEWGTRQPTAHRLKVYTFIYSRKSHPSALTGYIPSHIFRYPQPEPRMTLAAIQQVHPDAWVHFDQTAYDCGYHKPWMVWSTQDDDMQLLGEGRTEAEAIQDAVNNLEDE